MKTSRSFLLLAGLPLAVFGACSSEPPIETTTSDTGASSTNPGTNSTTGGTPTTASASGAGSTTTTAGPTTTSTSGGTPTTTSTSGSGSPTTSSTSTGGTNGTGGAPTTDGGTPTTDGMGGMPTTDGAAATTTGGEVEEPLDFGGLDGNLIRTPCSDTPSTDDCNGSYINPGETNRNTCAGGQALDLTYDYPITGGVAGQHYMATMHFYGVMEPKNYGNNDRREAGNQSPSNDNSGANPPPFYIGQAGQDYTQSDYNTYEIHVLDQGGQEIGVYFLNSDLSEGHWTYAINYERDIEVVAGGSIRLRVYDRNCRQIKNCGTGGFPCADKARTVDVSSVDPPVSFEQPHLGTGDNNHSGQWWVIDVTGTAPAQ